MQKHLLLFSIATLFSIVASASDPGGNITAHFHGMTNDTVVVWSVPLSDYSSDNYKAQTDTLRLTDGWLRPTLETTSPTYYMLIPKQLTDRKGHPLPCSCIHFFLDPNERILIRGVLEEGWVRTSVEGSQLNGDLSDFFNATNPTAAEMSRLQCRLEYDPAAAVDTLLKKSYRTCVQKLSALRESYITANPDREASGFILSTSGGAVIERLFHQLSPEVRNSRFKLRLDHIEQALATEQLRRSAHERIKPGAEAPDFTLKKIDGTDFTLSSLRGKYAVLDFWGSWCGWCIKGFPELKACYAAHGGDFTVVGIACHDTDVAWRKAVAVNQLPWINVINPRGLPTALDLDVQYGIKAYPTKIIIDPTGCIADIFVGERPGFAERMQELLGR